LWLDEYSVKSILNMLMPPRNPRSNPLALAVLACLLERPMHPYEISQTLKFRSKHESVRLNYGSLYGVVEGLERRGLIHAREVVREGRRPERTIYEITDAGMIELTDWLSDLMATPAKEYLQFEAALSFLPALPPDEALARLRDRCQALEIRLAQHRGARETALDMGLPRLFALEDEYVTTLLEAELDWVRTLVDDIESGRLEGLDGWQGLFPDESGGVAPSNPPRVSPAARPTVSDAPAKIERPPRKRK
jgi:DNA-binding PadR family transcriptional regulator